MNKYIVGLALATVILVGGIALSASESSDPKYTSWKNKFGIVFEGVEDDYRKVIFLRNLEIIESHNSNPQRTYDMGLNQFSALTDAEFASIYLTFKPFDPEWENVDVDETSEQNGNEIDWTKKGMVSPVKNQGRCGSCWAFSAVGTLESFGLMKGVKVNLSQQQLVDCSSKYGNFGCNGGYNYKALAYVKDHGIDLTSNYPYTAKTGTCKHNGGDFKIKSVPYAKGCIGIKTAVTSRPIGVSVDATNWSRYSQGIFNNCKTQLNHNVLLVGYADSYWKIKNSWGVSWGEQGYIRLTPGNTCGICFDRSPWPV